MAERFGNDLVLLERIAAGGMAEVYRAKQLGLSGFQKTIAVKRILPNYAMNEEFKAMFRDEANLTAMLAHQNIVQIFANGEFNDYLYLTMEFVDGKNARQLLARADKKKTRIPIEHSLYVIAEAAKGLDYAHGFVDEKSGLPLEIVHRDMSPQNLMVSYDGAVKIVDFGIAKAAARSGQTKAGVLKGKFGYMSPEQAQGLTLDRRTDIFAIGIILFELLTQRRLFTADDDLKTLQLVKDCRVPRPSKYNPDVTPALDNIVLKALSRERADRYANAGELFVELHRYLNQKYPKFLSTDLAKFVRDLFSEDIVEEKKKRDKANAEIENFESTSEPQRSSTVEASRAGSIVRNKSEEPPQDRTNVTESNVDGGTDQKSRNQALPDPIQSKGKVSEHSKGDVELPPPRAGDLAPKMKVGPDRLERVDLYKDSISFAGKPSYDAELLKAHLSRPIKMAPKSSKRVLSKGGIAATLVLVGIGIFSYFNPSAPPVCPAGQFESPAGSGQCGIQGPKPSSPCDPGFVKYPKGSGDCKSVKEICKSGEDFDEGREECVAIKEPVAQCPLELVMDPLTKKCAPKPVICAADELYDSVSRKCAPKAVVCGADETYDSQNNRCVSQPAHVKSAGDFVWTGEDFFPSGVLNLNSTPRAQLVMINGRRIILKDGKPVQTPVYSLRLKPGNYLLRVENSFFGWSREQRITIENSRTLDLDLH